MSSGKRINEKKVRNVVNQGPDSPTKVRARACMKFDWIFRANHPTRKFVCIWLHVSHRSSTQDGLFWCKKCFNELGLTGFYKAEQLTFIDDLPVPETSATTNREHRLAEEGRPDQTSKRKKRKEFPVTVTKVEPQPKPVHALWVESWD